MFVIKWKRPTRFSRWINYSTEVVTGLSSYSTEEAAQLQVNKFASVFKHNVYYVVRSN